MATKTVQDTSLTAVADAIRAKTGKSASMEFPDEFVSEIGSISGGGGELWKTVVLTEDMKTDSVATMVKWEEFLGITQLSDLEDYIYVAIFENNTQRTYTANMMLWTSYEGNFRRAYIRQNFTVANSNNGSCYANAGTEISIYKRNRV